MQQLQGKILQVDRSNQSCKSRMVKSCGKCVKGNIVDSQKQKKKKR